MAREIKIYDTPLRDGTASSTVPPTCFMTNATTSLEGIGRPVAGGCPMPCVLARTFHVPRTHAQPVLDAVIVAGVKKYLGL